MNTRTFPMKPCRGCGDDFQPSWSGNHFCSPRCQIMARIEMQPDGCWIWRGASAGGYGSLRVNGKTHRAHRLLYEIERGPIPEGLFLLHKCDNPPCVNPDHLRPGTNKENSDDAAERGRLAANKKLPHTKMGRDEFPNLVRLHQSGLSLRLIGARYGVCEAAVGSALRRGGYHIYRTGKKRAQRSDA